MGWLTYLHKALDFASHVWPGVACNKPGQQLGDAVGLKKYKLEPIQTNWNLHLLLTLSNLEDVGDLPEKLRTMPAQDIKRKNTLWGMEELQA